MDDTPDVGKQLHTIAHDAERLADLHVELLRSELRQSAAQAAPALVSLGAGAGLAVAGGIVGSLALVHALHRATRVPLWGCYGLVSGLLGASAVGLLGSGARQLAQVNVIPHETIATLKEDLEWLKGKTKS